MSAQTPKIKSNWWYTFPIFLGVFGGVISWFALKSNNKKLAKNCLILGIILSTIEISIFLFFLLYSDNLNIITNFGTGSEPNDFDFQFKLNAP